MHRADDDRPEAVTARIELAGDVYDARQRIIDLTIDLAPEQLIGPRLDIVNPPLWEAGHQAWFQEKWVLRHALGERPIRADADALWDSMAIPHDARWELALPGLEETLSYMTEVRDRVLERLEAPEPAEELLYFTRYSVFHEDMHGEALIYTRQTLGYPPPGWIGQLDDVDEKGAPPGGDAEVPGGTFLLGAPPDTPFAFDNEKWAHAVELEPFAIARTAVTQAEFAAFVDDAGYGRRELWSEEGWRWREAADAQHPVYWKLDPIQGWLRRRFHEWVLLEPRLPVVHVNWYEVQAFCRWAGRRLPTEAEWEVAAAGAPDAAGRGLSTLKRPFPWGPEPPEHGRANLDGASMGCIEVEALAAGDSAFGCRQMIGNVWEWTASTFWPYPGFERDAYREYSEPWFGSRKILRGGAWATRGRLIRNTWRNFFTPDRRDVIAGFRTVAAHS